MTLKDISYASLGLALVTYRRVATIAEKGVQTISAQAEQIQRLFRKPIAQVNHVKTQREKLEQRIDDGIQKAFEATGIPSQEDVRKLYAKLHQMTEKVKKVVTTQ